MSVWAARRRIYIITTATILAVFSAVFAIILLSYQPASCEDGKQNGSEFGIDCGGICPNECPVPPKRPLDLWTRAFPLADGVYAAVAYVENQNSDLYVPEVQFEIEVYDRNNDSITRASRRTPIMPGGVTPVFVPHIITKERSVSHATFRFVSNPKFAVHQNPYDIIFSNIDLDANEPSVSAVATNRGSQSLREVEFVVILYDADNVAVAASTTVHSHIRPGESRNLAYTWVHPISLRQGPCPGGTCYRPIERVEIIPIVYDE
ncbi:MAG: FxLYD domain-containing protein [Candidatus Kaiserbacteria bacterium]|nr:FxLYD domain-containing protein [Candidatus Kaiserbacteria bacterium]